MHLVYIDDSGDETIACYTALIIDAAQWRACNDMLHQLRLIMKEKCGVYTSIELHATDFLAARGKISDRKIERKERVSIARLVLRYYTNLPSLQVINATMELSEKERCFDWLINRIDTNMRKAGDVAMVISDNGKNYNAMLGRKRRLNDIPSMFGAWATGSLNTNIPVRNIIEQICYRDSASCPFVQAADFCAYALLRKERPLASQAGLGIDKLFDFLEPVLVKAANPRDPNGIVRWYK